MATLTDPYVTNYGGVPAEKSLGVCRLGLPCSAALIPVDSRHEVGREFLSVLPSRISS